MPDRTLAPEEFAERFEACSGVLWCIAAGVLNNHAGVEDVLQESAIIALRKLDTFDPSTSLVAWTGQIVRNVARNHARRARRRTGADVDLSAVPDGRQPSETSEDILTGPAALRSDQKSLDDRMIRALDRLDETARACLFMRALRGMSYKEISLAMEIPEGTASSHVHRARRAVRDALEREDASGQNTRRRSDPQ